MKCEQGKRAEETRAPHQEILPSRARCQAEPLPLRNGEQPRMSRGEKGDSDQSRPKPSRSRAGCEQPDWDEHPPVPLHSHNFLLILPRLEARGGLWPSAPAWSHRVSGAPGSQSPLATPRTRRSFAARVLMPRGWWGVQKTSRATHAEPVSPLLWQFPSGSPLRVPVPRPHLQPPQGPQQLTPCRRSSW